MGTAVFVANELTINLCTLLSTAAAMSAQTNSGVISPSASLLPQPSVVAPKMETPANNLSVDDLYKVAIDPNTNQEDLRDAWNLTKSTRVRKAIASNPNCDSNTMCMAARLYLKEVIANPSFEMLKLFNEDKFVKQIYDSYTDPQTFYKDSKLHSIRNVNGNRVNTARALLVSPHLRSSKILRDICTTLSGAEFGRELKDRDVFDNVRTIVLGNLGDFSLVSLMFLMHHNLINIAEFDRALSLSSGPSQYYISKGAYVKFVSGQMTNYPLLFKFLYVNRAIGIKDITKSIKDDPDLKSDTNLDTYAALYRDFLLHDVIRGRAKLAHDKARYGWATDRNLNDDYFSSQISSLIWAAIIARNITTGLEDVNLDGIYKDVARVGFDKDFGPYPCEIKLKKVFSKVKDRKLLCEQLLALTDDRAFEFFITSGMIWQEWHGKNKIGSFEFRVVDRINSINERNFLAGKKLLYRFSDLSDYHPVVIVAQENGSEHDPTIYEVGKENYALPAGSGLIDTTLIASMAVKNIG